MSEHYSLLVYSEVLKHGRVFYGAVDVIVEHCRGRDKIMRTGARERTKAAAKYIKGEPLSDQETSVIYEHGLRRFRAQVFRKLKKKGVVNDKINRTLLRPIVGSQESTI